MNAKDAILNNLAMSDMIIGAYLSDLSDDDLKVVAVEGMHPIAAQLGHLIASEKMMVDGLLPGISPALPEGFEEAHSVKADAASADSSRFRPKSEYLALINAQREATKQAIEQINEADLDSPGPESMRAYAPTVGAVLLMVPGHYMMHCGQWVAVRRKLGKPVTI